MINLLNNFLVTMKLCDYGLFQLMEVQTKTKKGKICVI